MTKIIKPKALTEDYLLFLDDLRDSGDTNMFAARPFLMAEFPELSKKEAGEILTYWMQTFDEWHLRNR